MYFLNGTLNWTVKNLETKTSPSSAMKRNWLKVTMFPAPGSTLGAHKQIILHYVIQLHSGTSYFMISSKKITFEQHPRNTRAMATGTVGVHNILSAHSIISLLTAPIAYT